MEIAKRFLEFVNQTGSPYHSVEVSKALLREAGFIQLKETASWQLARGGRYFVTKNNSAIFAFTVGKKFCSEKGGFVMFGAHTDSPCLRIRPNSNMQSTGLLQLGVETYGGGLWHTWFDRGLGFAGKVVVRTAAGMRETLVRVAKPICIIPNLAIHLSTDRDGFTFNKEIQLRPILGSTKNLNVGSDDSANRFSRPFLDLIAKEAGCTPEEVVDVDICLFDVHPSGFVGLDDEYIESARLDNLVSTWAGIHGLIDAGNDVGETDIAVAAAFDHEEAGSESWTGANSSCLRTWLERTLGAFNQSHDALARVLRRSMLFSADMAHGFHPNYSEKHQVQHRPMLNEGIVIKSNGNQRYATHALTAAFVRAVAAKGGIPVQDFVVRNDSPCGTTIGPILSSGLGIRAVDIGCAQWAMHSIRETCGTADLEHYSKFATLYFKHFRDIDTHVVHIDDADDE